LVTKRVSDVVVLEVRKGSATVWTARSERRTGISASTGFSSTGFLKETVGMADVTAEVTEDIFQDGRATLD
jgi:hypothetical protein